MLNTTNLLIILLIVLVLFLLLIMLGVSFYLFTKQKLNKDENSSEKTSLESEAIKEFLNKQKEEEKIVGMCCICSKGLVQNNHYEIDHLHFCKDHFNLYSDNEWVPITNQKTTADTPEAGVYIYNFKEDLWNKEQIPTYILCEYKLHMEEDTIETYVQLHCLENMKDILSTRLEGLKNNESAV